MKSNSHFPRFFAHSYGFFPPCNTGPEIDPFWYVGRGVRPIGRFGKRESDAPLQHALLLLLLSGLRNIESTRTEASSQNTDYFPELHKSYT